MISIQQLELLNTRSDVVIATRSATLAPSVCWSMGGHVAEDRKSATVWARRDHASQAISDIASNGWIAAVFTVPFTSFSLQLKGQDARVRAVKATDAALLERHVSNMVRELRLVNVREAFARAAFDQCPDDLVAIDFTIHAVFEQTPGPRAGRTVEPAP